MDNLTKGMIAGGTILISLTIWAIIYQAQREKEIYNERWGTNYTTSDFFFASGTINSIAKKVTLEER